MILRQPIGDCLKTEPGVTLESRLNISEANKTGVDVFSDKESDVDVGETEEFSEFEHGVNWALEW